VSAVLTVEHAQACLPLTPARLPGPRAAQSSVRRTIAQPAGPHRRPPWGHTHAPFGRRARTSVAQPRPPARNDCQSPMSQ
jgi:hypothetical protein